MKVGLNEDWYTVDMQNLKNFVYMMFLSHFKLFRMHTNFDVSEKCFPPFKCASSLDIYIYIYTLVALFVCVCVCVKNSM